MDLQLQALMRGELQRSLSKDSFDLAIEKHAKAFADSIPIEELTQDKLQTLLQKKAHLMQEVIAAAKMPELRIQLEKAFQILKTEGPPWVLEVFIDARRILMQLDFTKPLPDKFSEILKLDNLELEEALLKQASAKYEAGVYADCLALLSLLTTLEPMQADNWYRLGIAAQNCEKRDLAIRAYEIAFELDSKLVGALLFAAHCHALLREKEQAKTLIAQARQLSGSDKTWSPLLENLELLLEAA